MDIVAVNGAPAAPECPAHKLPMKPCATRYGKRYDCPVPGCTVACWSGETSTPADAETRTLRAECHKRFDALWKQYPRLFPRRRAAYKWLQTAMGLSEKFAHI